MNGRAPKFGLKSMLGFALLCGIGGGLFLRIFFPASQRAGWFFAPLEILGLELHGVTGGILALLSIPAVAWLVFVIVVAGREAMSAGIFLAGLCFTSVLYTLAASTADLQIVVGLLFVVLLVSVGTGLYRLESRRVSTIIAATTLWLAFWFIVSGFATL